LYVPVANPDKVVLAPVPEMFPGLIVQVPVGNPFNTTLPVATEQVGCVIVPTMGAEGVTGCALITILAEGAEAHPTVTV
jgi:hypothetical protein